MRDSACSGDRVSGVVFRTTPDALTYVYPGITPPLWKSVRSIGDLPRRTK